jgi:hypothetical protein
MRSRAATMHVNRKKNGRSTRHQISGPKLRALRKLQQEQHPKSALVFVNERGTPFDREASIGWSSAPAIRPGCRSRCTHTCCATLPAIRRRMLARTPGQSRLISATRTLGIRSANRAVADTVQELLARLTGCGRGPRRCTSTAEERALRDPQHVSSRPKAWW